MRVKLCLQRVSNSLLRASVYLSILLLFTPFIAVHAERNWAPPVRGEFQYNIYRDQRTNEIISINEKAENRNDRLSDKYSLGSGTSQLDDLLDADTHLEKVISKTKAHSIGSITKNLIPVGIPEKDKNRKRVRYRQVHKGIPVRGAELLLEMDNENRFVHLTGQTLKHIKTSSVPKISRSQVLQKIFSRFRGETRWRNARRNARTLARESCKDILHRTAQDRRNFLRRWQKYRRCFFNNFRTLISELRPKIYADAKLSFMNAGFEKGVADETTKLIWHVKVMMEKKFIIKSYLVDAHTGAILLEQDEQRSQNNFRQVFDCSFDLVEACFLDFVWKGYRYGRAEGNGPSGPNPQSGLDDTDKAYDMLGELYSLYVDDFNRNGGNNMGGIGDGIISPYTFSKASTFIENISETSQLCTPFGAQARLSGSIDLCGGSVHHDLVGHEYAHFVSAYMGFDGTGEPRQLGIYGETGSLNESFSDFMGEYYEWRATGSTDWKDLTGTGMSIRNLQDPPLGTNPTYQLPYPDRYTHPDFYCGPGTTTFEKAAETYTNTGVINKASYLMSEGGDFNGCQVTGIGIEKTAQIWYLAVDAYFRTAETFPEAYNNLQYACDALIGEQVGSSTMTQEDCDNIRVALQAVELDKAGGCIGPNQQHPNVGSGEPATCAQASMHSDFNSDNKVDALDWEIWHNTNGQSGSELAADANNDGVVNKQDCEIFQSEFGAGTCITDSENQNCVEAEYFVGDYNRLREGNSYVVSPADYTVWRDNLDMQEEGHPADGNGNGIIDGDDLLIWQQNYGRGSCFDPPSNEE